MRFIQCMIFMLFATHAQCQSVNELFEKQKGQLECPYVDGTGELELKSVGDGEVSFVNAVFGHGIVVIVRNGNYRMVYTGLQSTDLELGVEVGKEQEIGKVIEEGHDFQFQLWKEKEQLDEKEWLNCSSD